MPYTAYEEAAGVYRLDDGKMSSFYLVKGEKSALLVDTGMAEEPLLPFIRTLTDLPVTLLVTHGHGDHTRHAGEFDPVYMSPLDAPFLGGAFARLGIPEPIDASRFRPLSDGQRLKWDDFSVRCLGVGGHSPGSMVFYEENRRLLFTGDAVGSGVGVWMQLSGCLPIRQYRENLSRLDAFWAGLPADTRVFCGHWEQQFMAGDNPVRHALARDMIALCDDILAGRENRQPAPEAFAREYKPVYLAAHGRAAMVYTDRVIE